MLKHHNASAIPPERIVILGSGGFVGRSLSKYLASKSLATLGISSKEIDLSESAAVSKLKSVLKPTDCLVVLAALTPDKGKGIDTFMKNLRMIEHLCAALSDVSVAQVIYCSSDAVYPLSEPVVSEATPAAPADLYGVMHLSRELMLSSTLKVPLCIVRPTLIYGAEDTHNSYGPNRFRRQAQQDKKINLGGEGEETRDHVLIDDVLRLIALIADHRSEGVVNIASGRSLSFRQVADQIASYYDYPVEICTSARQVPITHRQFDIQAITSAFPGFTFERFESGSKRVHEQQR